MSQTIQQMIVSAAEAAGIDPNWALAVAQNESGFNQNAIGSSGEIGVFQLMPTTARDLGVDPTNLQQNINGGVAYLAQQYNTFGDMATATAAYNAGPNGNFNNSQTQSYVSNVMGTYGQLTGSGAAASLTGTGSTAIDAVSPTEWAVLAALAVGAVVMVGGGK
jgi:soluble lytic murein transglycosylase-like protein